MALILQTADQTFGDDSSRRRSTFYVPLSTEDLTARDDDDDAVKKSNENLYNPNLSGYSCDWSLNDSIDGSSDILREKSNNYISDDSNRLKRYGIVLNGSVNIDDSNLEVHANHKRTKTKNMTSSTPIKEIVKCKEITEASVPITVTITSPIKEKSKTLPVKESLNQLQSIFPPKNSFILKSTPKISSSINYTSLSDSSTLLPHEHHHNNHNQKQISSPKKSLSFIRRTHSTKLSRNNSLLKSLTSKCVEHSNESLPVNVYDLSVERLELYLKAENCDDLMKELFFREPLDISTSDSCEKNNNNTANKNNNNNNNKDDDDEDVHSDTSYEKACRRGSAPSTPMLTQKPESSTSRFTIFFSKRLSSFRSNPLKRTKSVTKLERTKRGNGNGGGIRGSRSHESLLSNHAVMSTVDLSVIGAVGVAPVHSSVLGRRHCFQVRGGPRGERYYSCGSRQERDLWIYSLRKSIQPNAESIRRTDNSLKMWIYEAKSLPPKKKYFCEICLDKTLYGRTSVKLKTDLLFWGEHFDFPDIPEINVIYVNVFRECEKKKKRDKHVLIGTVKIPIHEVTCRTFSEDWYPIISDKHDSLSKNSTKDPMPTLRIKCRFQSIDILPLDVYSTFQSYLKEHYKKICECLEPVIGVKAKEDIGQAMVLLMHHQSMAAEFLTEIITLDLLRVGDQRLTFRGNSLATKSMEAFLKLTGEQYLQDTLSSPINEIITSERDCEVDPLKASGSLSRQQQSLRSAVKLAWNAIYESHRQFPSQLRECFATFRERLINIGREDMADNLISASIFLRFLCPAILSPSLFNITNELPSQRATRNLTLVAKTLQTLANFTRFQGKENFMEFLNDFLEQEAPRMKDFLIKISTRIDHHHTDTILEWSGYIDQGKQLSVLHSLLVENLPKLPPQKQSDMTHLTSILDRISQIKESTENNYQRHLSEQNFASMEKINGHKSSMSSLHVLPNQPNGERGIIRGVLTPNSLQKNIFCYNDPTVYSLLNNDQKMSFNPLQHSHSTSSIQSSHLHNNSIMNNPNSIQHHNITSTKRDNYYQITSSLARNEPKSPVTPSSMRASTLPRNNNNQQLQNDESNIIQIGLDPSNPFSRKSPTPRMHQGLLTTANGKAQSSVYTNGRQLNGSQLSLLSDRSQNQYYHNPHHHMHRTNALNLGIPHTEAGSSSYESPNSNMPRDLEDFDDLIKYSEEMEQRQQKQDQNIHHHPNLKAKGSNVSIGHSSGYQSIQTQSQSSSPIENVIITTNGHPNGNGQSTIQQNIEFFNSKIQSSSSSSNASTANRPTKLNGKYGYISPKYSVVPPLAFKNPLYQLQNGNGNNNNNNNDAKSSSLTPSSSEERIMMDDRQNVLNNNNNLVSSTTNVPGVIDTSSLNGRRMGSNRMPRTNPLVQYKRDDGIYDNHNNNNNANNNNINNNNNNQLAYFNNRYERRLSVESARTLSDSSTDDDEVHHHKEGKRRRNMNKSSIEQCEKEIHRLQSSVDILRQKLEESELKETSDSIDAIAHQSDNKIRSIISRLLAMEEELRREQYKMSLIINHKQRVIEAQGQQIAELDAANNRLLSELTCLRNRYEMKNGTQVLAVTEDDDTTNF